MIDNRQPKEFEEKVIQVNRVSKKTKGGNKIGFSVLIVAGDRKNRVGVGMGKSGEVPAAVQKAILRAKKNMITLPEGKTFSKSFILKEGAAKLLIKPAPKGNGLKAGGSVRSVFELAGVKDVTVKILGTNNKVSNVYAAFSALRNLKGDA